MGILPEQCLPTPKQMASLISSAYGDSDTASNLKPPHRFDDKGRVRLDRVIILSDSSMMLADNTQDGAYLSQEPILRNAPGLQGATVAQRAGAHLVDITRWAESALAKRGAGSESFLFQKALRESMGRPRQARDTVRGSRRRVVLGGPQPGASDHMGCIVERRTANATL